jgi:hypothetical protein
LVANPILRSPRAVGRPKDRSKAATRQKTKPNTSGASGLEEPHRGPLPADDPEGSLVGRVTCVKIGFLEERR